MRRLPDWKPIALSPPITVLAWSVAYWVAEHRGAPVGDTNFAVLPLLLIFWAPVWLAPTFVLLLLLLLVRATISERESAASMAVVVLAALVNVSTVILIYGVTLSDVGNDGWPDDSVALIALATAAIVSLSPIGWLLAPRRERSTRPKPTVPRGRPQQDDGSYDWDAEDHPTSWW